MRKLFTAGRKLLIILLLFFIFFWVNQAKKPNFTKVGGEPIDETGKNSKLISKPTRQNEEPIFNYNELDGNKTDFVTPVRIESGVILFLHVAKSAGTEVGKRAET